MVQVPDNGREQRGSSVRMASPSRRDVRPLRGSAAMSVGGAGGSPSVGAATAPTEGEREPPSATSDRGDLLPPLLTGPAALTTIADLLHFVHDPSAGDVPVDERLVDERLVDERRPIVSARDDGTHPHTALALAVYRAAMSSEWDRSPCATQLAPLGAINANGEPRAVSEDDLVRAIRDGLYEGDGPRFGALLRRLRGQNPRSFFMDLQSGDMLQLFVHGFSEGMLRDWYAKTGAPLPEEVSAVLRAVDQPSVASPRASPPLDALRRMADVLPDELKPHVYVIPVASLRANGLDIKMTLWDLWLHLAYPGRCERVVLPDGATVVPTLVPSMFRVGEGTAERIHCYWSEPFCVGAVEVDVGTTKTATKTATKTVPFHAGQYVAMANGVVLSLQTTNACFLRLDACHTNMVR